MGVNFREAFNKRDEFFEELLTGIQSWVDSEADTDNVMHLAEELLRGFTITRYYEEENN